MTTKYLRTAASLTLISIMVSGCADTADGRKTQAQGTVGGAAVGALLGAAMGGILGGPGGAARGAAMGAIAGSAHGFAYGSAVAARKARYARAEQWLDAEIAIARKENQRAIAYNQSLKARLASLENRARIAQSTGDQNALRGIRKEVGAIQSQTANQAASEKQHEKEQGEVLGNGEAKAAGNYSEYRQASQAWGSAKSERATLISRTASLKSSIGG